MKSAGTNLLPRSGVGRGVQRREDPAVPSHFHKAERADDRCHLCGRWPRKRCYVWSCLGDPLTGSCQRHRHRRGCNPDEYLIWRHEPDCPMPEIMERYWALPQAERERLIEYIQKNNPGT